MYKYGFDILEALKDKGYSTYRIRKEKIFGEAVIQKIRDGNIDISVRTILKLIELLNCSFEQLIVNDDQQEQYNIQICSAVYIIQAYLFLYIIHG